MAAAAHEPCEEAAAVTQEVLIAATSAGTR